MKWGFIGGLVVMFVLMMMFGFTTGSEESVAAETPEPTPEVVIIQLIETPEPTAAATMVPQEITITEHPLNDADVEIIAKLLWMSPLRSRTSKAALVWVVCNRIDSDDFPSTVAEVVTVSEFAFYSKRAHISEENTELVRLVLNQWLSERDGNNAGRLVPKTGLFTRFSGENNRNLNILDARGGNTVYYPMRGAYDYE